MNVLFVTPRVPWPPDHGGRIRTLALLDGLRARHDVHVVCGRTEEDADPDALRDRGFTVTSVAAPTAVAPGSLIARLAKILRAVGGRSYLVPRIAPPGLRETVGRLATGADVVVLDHLWTIDAVDDLRGPVVFSSHNVESDAVRQAAAGQAGLGGFLARREVRALERLERRLLTRAALTVTVSRDDAAAFARLAPDAPESVVVANGAHVAKTPLLAPPVFEPLRMLYVGGYDYPPNAEAADVLVRDVLPRVRKTSPAAEVLLVGADPGDRLATFQSTSGVRILGRVDDLEPVYADASVVVVPLRHGGGSRLKIVEAWTYGRPVVSSPAGAAGLEARSGVHLLLAGDADGLADAVLACARDRGLVKGLVESGRQLARDAHDWPTLAACFVAAIEGCTPRKSAHPSS